MDINGVTKVVSGVETTFMMNFDTWVNTQLMNNDFLVGGLATIAASAGLYLLRNVPFQVYRALQKRLTYTVSITSDNDYYQHFCREINKTPYHFLSRNKSVDKDTLSAGYGTTISKFMGRFVIAHREIQESDSSNFKQILKLTFPFISYKKLEVMVTDFFDTVVKNEKNMLKIYAMQSHYLHKEKLIPVRSSDSVFSPLKIVKDLEKKIDNFQASREWYKQKGIPYKYAILLYGPPGTGKTTLAKYLAGYAKRSMIVTDPENVTNLSKAIFNATSGDSNYLYDVDEGADQDERFLCLMEDIDCYGVVKSRDEETKTSTSSGKNTKLETVNLSKILNSIDGLNAPEDAIIIATTNNLESIDPALVRKGRFDDVVFIGPLGNEDIQRMISFYVDDEEFLNRINKYEFAEVTGAVLQDVLINNYKDPESILSNLIYQEQP